MAVHFRNGTDHKNYLPVPPPIYQKAVEASRTYDWVEEPIEEVEQKAEENKTEEKEENKEEEVRPEYPKKFKCSKTGIVATKMRDDDPVMFVKGELLTLTADEQTVKDIIE